VAKKLLLSIPKLAMERVGMALKEAEYYLMNLAKKQLEK